MNKTVPKKTKKAKPKKTIPLPERDSEDEEPYNDCPDRDDHEKAVELLDIESDGLA